MNTVLWVSMVRPIQACARSYAPLSQPDHNTDPKCKTQTLENYTTNITGPKLESITLKGKERFLTLKICSFLLIALQKVSCAC